MFIEEGSKEKYFLLSSSLNPEEKEQLVWFLKDNINVFALQPYDMPGIDFEVICHKLHINLTTKPIKQKPRRTSPEKAKAVEEEVHKLLKAGAIKEAKFSDWIINPVAVKRHNRKCRVCVDFTDLNNKACRKDSFPLPKIDQLVNSAAGHERMSFLDAYSGCHTQERACLIRT